MSMGVVNGSSNWQSPIFAKNTARVEQAAGVCVLAAGALLFGPGSGADAWAAEDDTRQVISLTVDAESVTEGALAGITLTRSGNIDEGLSLTAHVLETGAMLAFPAETPDGKPIIRDLQFSASSTTATLQEATVDDTTDEPDSEMTFCPDTAGGDVYRIELPVCVSVTVLDDDGEPVLSIMDAAGTEDSVGNLAFEVRLSEESGFETAVDYATSNGTATAGDDYTPTTGTLTFAAGQVANTINVPVLLDGIPEENETFTVVLSNAVKATLGTRSATAGDAEDTLRHGNNPRRRSGAGQPVHRGRGRAGERRGVGVSCDGWRGPGRDADRHRGLRDFRTVRQRAASTTRRLPGR